MRKVLVVIENYSTIDNKQTMAYVHARNKYYLKCNIDVTVLSFRAKCDYVYENVKVITEETFKSNKEKYDILICHSPNIKHHYKFLCLYGKFFKKILFFFHGHEILRVNEVYPPKYKWIKDRKPKIIQDFYDSVKFFLWKKMFYKIVYKSHFIFVSNWLYYRFLFYIHLNPKVLENKVSIINNSVGSIFEEKNFNYHSKKIYDFITIRGDSLDGSKYGIDLVNELAKMNPDNKFLIIGIGNFYKYNEKPNNVEFLEKRLSHEEMLSYIDQSRCALLLTREDTQGVLTCEMMTYGIPTITSDIEICQEIFKGINNVKLINNNDLENVNLNKIISEFYDNTKIYKKNKKYFSFNTIQKEVELILNL